MSDPKDEDIEAVRARARALTDALGVQVEKFAAAAGPDSLQRRMSDILTNAPLPAPGKLPPLGPILDSIQAKLIPLAGLKLFLRLMLLVKEWTECDSSPAP